MRVFIERTKEEVEHSPCSVRELLSSLGIVADEVLVMRNGSLVTLDALLGDDDEVKVLSVISGG